MVTYAVTAHATQPGHMLASNPAAVRRAPHTQRVGHHRVDLDRCMCHAPSKRISLRPHLPRHLLSGGREGIRVGAPPQFVGPEFEPPRVPIALSLYRRRWLRAGSKAPALSCQCALT